MRYLVVLLLVLASYAAATEQLGWRDQNGNPVANSESQKSIDGFGGWLVVTPDQDWQRKWETPVDHAPRFRSATTVRRGEKLSVLIMFANAGVNAMGRMDVACDIQVVRPDKSLSVNEKDVPCYQAEIKGAAENLRLSQAVLEYLGEDKDPPGRWHVRVLLKDTINRIEIPLQTSFVLLAGSKQQGKGQDGQQ